jgi:hypothetical protein
VPVSPSQEERTGMTIEIRFSGPTRLEVRILGTTRGGVQSWDTLTPGSVHTPTGKSYEELRALGEGVKEIN